MKTPCNKINIKLRKKNTLSVLMNFCENPHKKSMYQIFQKRDKTGNYDYFWNLDVNYLDKGNILIFNCK